jgi:hypothetical protein
MGGVRRFELAQLLEDPQYGRQRAAAPLFVVGRLHIDSSHYLLVLWGADLGLHNVFLSLFRHTVSQLSQARVGAYA